MFAHRFASEVIHPQIPRQPEAVLCVCVCVLCGCVAGLSLSPVIWLAGQHGRASDLHGHAPLPDEPGPPPM